MENTIQPGLIFKHYKGELYEFLYFAKHSETLENLVVYKALYGSYDVWVRPKSMFFETLEVNGIIVPRFQIYEENEKIQLILSSEISRNLEDAGIVISDIIENFDKDAEVFYNVAPVEQDGVRNKDIVLVIISSAVGITLVIRSITNLIKSSSDKASPYECIELEEVKEDGEILKSNTGLPILKKTSVIRDIDSNSKRESFGLSFKISTKGILLKFKHDIG